MFWKRFLVTAALAGALPVSGFLLSAQTAETSTSTLTFVGTTLLGDAQATNETEVGFKVSLGPDVAVRFPKLSGTISPARVPAAHVPTASGNPVAGGSFFGFLGLTHRDQRFAATGVAGGSNSSLEPPDQALAVGNGFVVEAVNNAIAVFDAATGTRHTRPKAMSAFFNLAPDFRIVGDQIVFGPFLADPRAYFDWDTGHFFVTEVVIDTNPNTGRFANAAKVFIAVSETSDPRGHWNIFQLDVTNDGDAVFGSCPCLGDQPLIGADKFGFYVSTNAFAFSTFGFRGEQLYAISKQALVAGTPPSVSAVRLHNLTQAEGPAFSLQPATVPPNGTFETGNNGTEYFVSSLDFTGTLDNRLTVWALTNTSSLETSSPTLQLAQEVITTQVYGQPPDAQQEPGPTPLLDLLASSISPVGVSKNHLELVASNDDRMNQVVFAGGKLWTALNTVVKTPQGPVRTGVAFFILSPVAGGGHVDASVVNQGYVAINSPHQDSVMYPSIGVNAAGKAVIAFSVIGQDFFPSAAYSILDATQGAGPIVISGPGAFPEDGFSGYFPFAVRVARWGDYSAAVADENGAIWMGNENIPNAPRSVFANWGTFITKVNP